MHWMKCLDLITLIKLGNIIREKESFLVVWEVDIIKNYTKTLKVLKHGPPLWKVEVFTFCGKETGIWEPVSNCMNEHTNGAEASVLH